LNSFEHRFGCKSSRLQLSSKVPAGYDKTGGPDQGLAYATRVRAGPELLEIGKARFLAELDSLVEVYAAAMRPPREQVPGRRAIMERHTQFPSFRAVVVTAPDGPPGRGDGPRPGTGRPPIIAFSYGFHGADGQWWHDLVRAALIRVGGYELAQTWLADSFEVAEVHVHPDYQGRGIGARMVPVLLHPRLERTALLSTQDADTPARRLYRGLGFGDLITGYRFPGTDPPYAVMGAVLPLRPGPRPPRRG
jgi:ribosomal protein S18 acetylase RimI-like enzyme